MATLWNPTVSTSAVLTSSRPSMTAVCRRSFVSHSCRLLPSLPCEKRGMSLP